MEIEVELEIGDEVSGDANPEPPVEKTDNGGEAEWDGVRGE